MEWLGDLLGFTANAATGGLFGVISRTLPEFFKIWTAKGDRAHELAMRELDWKIAKEGGEQKIREQDTAGYWAATSQHYEALKAALQAQATPTGIPWVDALNALVRPAITYYFALLYGGVKIAAFVLALLRNTDLATSLTILWGPADTQMFFGILGFWFVGRVFDERRANR